MTGLYRLPIVVSTEHAAQDKHEFVNQASAKVTWTNFVSLRGWRFTGTRRPGRGEPTPRHFVAKNYKKTNHLRSPGAVGHSNVGNHARYKKTIL
jgi:hypothetical protein